MAQLVPSDKCEICTENQGQFSCEECVQVFCTKCKAMHLRMKASSNHSFNDTARFRGIVTKCAEHDSEYVYYCENCHRLVCNICTVKSHKGHEMADILSATEEVKHEIEDALEFYLENIKNQKRQSLVVKNQIASLRSEKDKIMQFVEDRCKFLHSKIDQTRKSIQSEINERGAMEISAGESFVSKVDRLEKEIAEKRKQFESHIQDRNAIKLIKFAENFREDQSELGRDLPEKPNITKVRYYQETSDDNYIVTTLKNLFGTIEFSTDSKNDLKHSDCKQQ